MKNQWQSLALFVIFPASFAFVTLGAGFPTIIAINSDAPAWLVWVSAVLSIAFAATTLWWTAQLLVVRGAADPKNLASHNVPAMART
jgi:hypothetical protein